MVGISNDLSLEERETTFSVVANDRGRCHVFTDDPVWFDRLARWFDPVRCDGKSAEFSVPADLVLRQSALLSGTSKLERYRDAEIRKID